ncbi:hypothetical protein [Emcibacter sp.]|uniref:hypothetical protein n=1 Tax=Emcibacter sp. TaxID=1979954 RepID=UPI003A92ECA9
MQNDRRFGALKPSRAVFGRKQRVADGFDRDALHIVGEKAAAGTDFEPVRSVIERVYPDSYVSFAQAQQRHTELVAKVNAEVCNMGGDNVMWTPICAEACEPGDFSSYLLEDLLMDPFLKWNMLYFANDEKTAFLFDTLVYDEKYVSSFSDEMLSVILESNKTWEKAKEQYFKTGDSVKLLNHRDYIRISLAKITADIEKRLFAGKKNHLQHLFAPKKD